MRHSSLAVGSLVALLLTPLPQPANAETRENEARMACLTGDTSRGVAILAELYVRTDDPTHIYNQARCFELAGRCADAVPRFREYLRKANNLSEKAQGDVRRHISECEAPLPGSARPSVPPASPGPPVAAQAPSRPPVVDAHAVSPGTSDVAGGGSALLARTSAGPRAATNATSGRGLRTGGIVVASVGLAALVAGVVLNLSYNSTISDLEDRYREGNESSNETKKTLAWVGYGTGTACLAAGALFYYLGWKKASAVAPATVSGAPGLLLTGGF